MKARPVTAGGAEVSGKERDGKRKEQTRAETEARVKKRSHNVQIARGEASLSEQRRPRSETA